MQGEGAYSFPEVPGACVHSQLFGNNNELLTLQEKHSDSGIKSKVQLLVLITHVMQMSSRFNGRTLSVLFQIHTAKTTCLF